MSPLRPRDTVNSLIEARASIQFPNFGAFFSRIMKFYVVKIPWNHFLRASIQNVPLLKSFRNFSKSYMAFWSLTSSFPDGWDFNAEKFDWYYRRSSTQILLTVKGSRFMKCLPQFILIYCFICRRDRARSSPCGRPFLLSSYFP